MEFKLAKTLLSNKPSSKSVIIAMFSLMVMTLLFWSGDRSFVANGKMVYQDGQYWKAFTTSLLHADLSHLANNTFFFTGLAILLNHYFGFLIFPVLSLVVGGFINLVVLKFYPPEVSLVGISGVIYFMAAFWLTLYVGIERKISLTRRLINATGLTLIFLFPDVLKPQVSYLAHSVGFAFGFILGLTYYFFKRTQFREEEVWVRVEKDPMDDIILLSEEDYSSDPHVNP